MRTNQFKAAMVSTAQNAKQYNDIYCICVFTEDWQDKASVFRAKDAIKSLGISFEMKYKRDIDTMNNVEKYVY